MDFKGFRRRFEACETVLGQQDLVDQGLAAVPTWPEQTCREWLRGVSSWNEEIGPEGCGAKEVLADAYAEIDPDLNPDAVWDSVTYRLPQALIDRLVKLKCPLDLDEIRHTLCNCSINGGTFDLPRRFLIQTYRKWIEEPPFTPGLFEYRVAALRASTAQEAEAIGDSLATSLPPEGELERFVVKWWIMESSSKIWTGRPESLPSRIEILKSLRGADQDEEVIIWVADWQRKLQAIAGSELPEEFVQHFYQSTITHESLGRAKQSIDSVPRDAFRVDLGFLVRMLDRDQDLLRPRLPRHIARIACPEAKEILQSYRRLESTGEISPVVACALLTQSIRVQLATALVESTRYLNDCDRKAIWKAGLAAIARWIAEEHLSDHLGKVACRFCVCEAGDRVEMVEFLRKAGKIRDRLHHHDAERLRAPDADYLRRRIFDSGPEECFARMSVMRLEKRKEA